MNDFRWHVLSECADEDACPIHGRDAPRCAHCLDDGIVCEEHPEFPWEMTVEGHNADCGPPGVPCPACCSPIPEDGSTPIGTAFTPDWLRDGFTIPAGEIGGRPAYFRDVSGMEAAP